MTESYAEKGAERTKPAVRKSKQTFEVPARKSKQTLEVPVRKFKACKTSVRKGRDVFFRV